jgi:hypothetical protein
MYSLGILTIACEVLDVASAPRTQGPDSEYSGTLRIHVLSKIACTIKVHPLRRLVNNNIEFSASDSLSKLRRER